MRVSKSQFEALVRQAIELLPEQFQRRLENLSVEVFPRLTGRLARELGLEGMGDLMGAYVGVPLTEKSVSDIVDWPERIVIFQQAIEAESADADAIVEQVRITVLHEIAHHFGMSEEDLGELGYE
jgi:predicted Zn-dependent protease with MMP-like domain